METTKEKRGKRTHKVSDSKNQKPRNGKDDDGFDAGPINTNIRQLDEGRKRARPKQQALIDVDPVIPEAVKRAAEDYLEVLDQRIALQQREPDLRQGLIDLMLRHQCAVVKINGETLTLETLHKVKKTTDKDVE